MAPLALALALLALVACNDPFKDKPVAVLDDVPATAGDKILPQGLPGDLEWPLDAASSRLGFVAVKPTATREGSFELDDGTLFLREGRPMVLAVAVKTNTLKTDPVALQEHLLGADFLDVERYPKARLVAQIELGAGEHAGTLVGVLELHSVRKRIRVPFTVVQRDDDSLTAETEFLLERHAFEIRYDGAADDLIRPQVLLQVRLRFVAPPK